MDVGRVAQDGHDAWDLDAGVARCQGGEGAEGEAGHIGADLVDAVVEVALLWYTTVDQAVKNCLIFICGKGKEGGAELTVNTSLVLCV